MTSAPFVVSASENSVSGWAAAPLPFEPSGWMLQYRHALRAALRRLDPAGNRTLVGEYASGNARPCDVENLLLYNVGVSAFSHLRTDRVVLTRSSTPRPPPEGASAELTHHHRYEMAGFGLPPAPDSMLACVAPTPLRTPLQIEKVWYDIRSRDRVIVGDSDHRAGLDLRLTIHRPPDGSQRALLGMVKAAVDGFIAALHGHDGTQLDVVAERLGTRLGVAPAGIAGMLMANPAGVLGVRRLVWPFRDFVQWNPADDAIVRLQVSTATSATWQLSGTVTTMTT